MEDVTLGRSNNVLRAEAGIQNPNWLGPGRGNPETEQKDVLSLSLVAVGCTTINMLLQQKSKMQYSALEFTIKYQCSKSQGRQLGS